MEMVLDIYKRPYDPKRPVLCMDESPRQLIAEAKSPIATAPGQPARYDYEYRRCGTYNVFLVCEPLAGKRFLDILETKTKRDWACFLETIADEYKNVQLISLVMDNLNTHTSGALWDRFEFFYTAKHGNYLKMAKIEINGLNQTKFKVVDLQYLQCKK